MNTKRLRVISRNSPLALLQVEELFSLYPSLEYDVTEVASYGDKHKGVSLFENIAGDFFTRELDRAILVGDADIAVHSAKDLPYPLPDGLELYCLTEAADKSDSLVSRGSLRLSELKPGSRIGTSSPMRKAELLQFRQDIEVVSIRGTIEERIAQVDDGYVDALIVATCALDRLGLSDRIAERLPFRTHPLQGNLAVVGRTGNADLKNLFSQHDIRRRFGRVALIGFGPGNPDLITVAGDSCLKQADVIFYDDLIDHEALHRYAAEKVYVGKRSGKHSHRQDEINEMLYQAALNGKVVARLKGGDPMVFAHGREEVDYLSSRFVDVSIIPGISTGIAFSAYTRIPLTHRGVASSVAFVNGHGSAVRVPSADTLVYYMGGANIPKIAAALIQNGRGEETPAALVYNVSLPNQKEYYSTLGELRYTVVKYPTPIIMVVGNVVLLERRGERPMEVLSTGTTAPASDAVHIVTHTPLIKISGISMQVGNGRDLVAYDWIIFTSRYGVRFYFDILDRSQVDVRALSTAKIASVGPVTSAELKAYHIRPDMESPTESAEGIVAFFRTHAIAGKKVLLPRSDKGLAFLSDGLKKLGNEVTDFPVYKNTVNDAAEKVDLSRYEKILFDSPSGVEAFKEIYTDFPQGVALRGKGKTTTNKIKEEIS